MADAPILRLTDANGEAYDDPSEDMLFMVFEDLEEPGAAFLLERVEPGREGERVRVELFAERTYALEGFATADRLVSPSMRNVHEALTRWAFDLPDWRELLSSPDAEA